MTAVVKVLAVGAPDLGVVSHNSKKASFYTIEFDKQKKTHAVVRIKSNTHNEYVLNDNLTSEYPHFQVYDNQTKILDWNLYEDGTLVVQSYTTMQIHLSLPKIKKCLIKAQGPLFINSALDCQSSIDIDAEALWFSEAITNNESICLNVRKGVGFFAPVKAKKLTINATYIHQEADLQVSELLDVSTQFFKQYALVNTSIKSLRLIATQCEMQGELTVNGPCFFTANTVVWGHETTQTTFRFLGESYIRAASLHLKGDMQVRINNPELNKINQLAKKDIERLVTKKKGIFAVENDWVIDEQAVVVFANTLCFTDKIENQGQLIFDNCILKAKTVCHYGVFEFKQSAVVIDKEFTQRKTSLTELDDCVFNVLKTNVYGGEFHMVQCLYKGNFCNVYNSVLDLKKSRAEINQLFVDTHAQAEINTSQFRSNISISALGRLLFDNATIHADSLKVTDGKFSSKNSKITIDGVAQLSGTTDLADSDLISSVNITIEGILAINKAQLRADSLELKPHQANISSLSANARDLRLHGSKKAEQVIFHNSALVTQILTCVNHITFNSSIFYGIPDKEIIHDLRARLKLKNSKFITENDIRNYQNGKIELEDKSIMKVRLLHSQGAMKARESKLFCRILWQENSNIELVASTVQIEEQLTASSSQMELKKGSTLAVSMAELLDKSALILKEGSVLVAQSELINDYTSTVSSSNSQLSIKRFKSLGRTELSASLLSAKELLIYDQFEAHSLTKISVEELITITLKAHVTLDSSIVVANELSLSGKMDVTDSVVKAKKNAKTYSASNLVLKGEARVEAEHMNIGGTVEVQTASKMDNDKPANKAKPLVKVTKELYVSEHAMVKGNEDLQIDAEKCVHSGTLSLSGKLKATGGLLINVGSMTAESIHLGFDDQVRNFGSLSAEDLTVHSNLVNLRGQICTRKSFVAAGLYNLNVGLIAANSYSNLSLLSLNSGIIVPNFSADPEYYFTWSNALSLAKITASALFPQYSTIINTANLFFKIPSVINSGASLYKMANSFSVERYKTMRRHELMAEVCQLKSYISPIYSAFNMVYSASEKMIDEFGEMKLKIFDVNNYSAANFESLLADIDYTSFAKLSAGVFLGNYTDESLVSANLGFSLAIDTAKKNLFAFNGGIECSLLSHNINNQIFFNTGWSGGTDTNISTHYSYNTGTLEGLNQLTFNAERVINKGIIDGNNVRVAIEHLTQDGDFNLRNGRAKIDEYDGEKEGNNVFSDMQVSGIDLQIDGHLEAEKCQFTFDNTFELQADSLAKLQQVAVKTHEFTAAGQLNYEEVLSIEADSANLKNGAVINGKKTDEEALYVTKADDSTTATDQGSPAEQSVEPSTTDNQKEFKPQHILQLKIKDTLELGGKLQGGDYVQIQGQHSKAADAQDNNVSEPTEGKEKIAPKCAQIIIGDNAEVNLSRGSIDAERVKNSGQLDLNQFTLTVDELEQNKQMKLDSCVANINTVRDEITSKTEINTSLVNGSLFTASGQLETTNSRFKYDEKFQLEQTAKVATNNTEIITNTFDDSADLTYTNVLSVNATHVVLGEGSKTIGQQSAEEDLFEAKTIPAPMEGSETTSQETNATNNSTEQKEFKPQHILDIKAEQKIELNGSLTGGDYTSIKGKQEESTSHAETDEKKTSKVEAVVIGANADIKLNHGSIDARNLENKGQTSLSNFALDVDTLDQKNKMTLDGGYGHINKFADTETAHTEILNFTQKGTIFNTSGALDTTNSSYENTSSFEIKSSGHINADNVQITTNSFEHEGVIDYQNILAIKADNVDLKKNSSMNGKKTNEEDLFVTKVNEENKAVVEPNIEQQATEQPTASTVEAASEPAKEFKPQNILTIETKTGLVNGVMKGGDYTVIKGIPTTQSSDNPTNIELPIEKSESIHIGEFADVDLQYGSISSKQLDISSQLHLRNFNVDADKTILNQKGKLALTQSVYKGEELISSGLLSMDSSVASFSQKVELSQLGRETLKDSSITTSQFTDNSLMTYQGQAAIFADDYQHNGQITKSDVPEGEDKSLFYVKAKTAHLNGVAHMDNGIFDIEHFADANKFVEGIGSYSGYQATSSLELDTEDNITLNSSITRDCDVTVKATGITMTADYNKGQTLNLISTQEDIKLLSNMNTNNLYVKSAKSIRTNHNLYSNGVANFEADAGFYNQGGVINANTVGIKASEIQNISAGSYAASSAEGVAMGAAGIINGRKDVYLEATSGDIANYGGIIRSGNYTQLLAQGDVVNACNIRTSQGAFDSITSYDAGLISGGSGSETDGVGLYIKAQGKVRSDASTFVSNGSNYIEGDKGIELNARQETHISDITRKNKWYGKSSEIITTTTKVTSSTVQSATGANILKSGQGGVTSVATNFVSPGGTQVYARDNVNLYSLKTQNRQYTSSSSLWGLSKHSTSSMHEEAIPTLFFDNGVTHIESEQGTINARGAYFGGDGHLEMLAKNGRITFGADVLNHEVVEKSRSFGVSVPGMGALNAWKTGDNAMDVLTAEDATLAKLNSMLNSNNTTELLANSANLGINLYNTTNNLARGFANDTLKDELLARYGLGGANGQGFSPTINLSMSESTTRSQYQTQGTTGVNRGGNVYLEAGEGIDLENGVRVHAGGNMVVDAPEILATAAELHSSFEQTNKTQSIGVSAFGQLQDVGLGYSHTSTAAIQHLNGELSADGHMKLGYHEGAMHHLSLDGAVLKASSLDAHIEQLSIKDKQDFSVTKTESLSASLSGQISAHKGQGDSAIVNEHSGIFVNDNTGHSIHIDDAHMTGGKILVNSGDLTIDKLVTEQVIDHQTYSGVGISFNVNDLQRLAGHEASNQTGEQAIAIAEINIDKINYKAEHTAVVHGDGTNIEIKQVQGDVHTQSADGTTVIKKDELHLTLDVPLTNKTYIETSRENLQAGMEKMVTVLGLNEQPKTQLPIQEEPVLPARRNEEEEEEEEELGEKAVEEPNLDEQQASLLNSEDLQVFWQEVFSSLPSDKQKELQETMGELQYQVKKDGKASANTSDKLKKQMLSAINMVMKAGSEDMCAKLTKAVGADSTEKIFKMLASPDALSKLTTNFYLGSKGNIYISFTFNLFGASLDGEKDVWNRAIKNTAGDFTLNFAIKSLAAELSGPIGWGFVGLGVIDTFLYDEKIITMHIESGSEFSAIGLKNLAQGHSVDGVFMMQLAQANYQIAANLEVMHYISNMGAHIGDGFSDVWGKIRGKEKSLESNKSVASNRNSFFSPEKSDTKSEASTQLKKNEEEYETQRCD